MIDFIATNTSGFENWTGASIDSKPLELYDPTGQKLYYQFSVYKNKTLIGIIDIAADKRLGQTVQLVLFEPKPFDATTAMNKSREIAKFASGVPGHVRMCRGYKISGSNEYLRIGNPNPIYFCVPYWEAFGSEIERIYVRS